MTRERLPGLKPLVTISANGIYTDAEHPPSKIRSAPDNQMLSLTLNPSSARDVITVDTRLIFQPSKKRLI